ncbi:hypothetical protein Ocin01_05247 [Orchesella cincta]|uniref:Uncharacterized protein n=1 Tax=Orchesella cincta TaxID=48709 RepID=A0A1D2N848_ORCCI|nr:hypothetical protein Ocin01_05247 [Orchesella cincta]
MNSSANLISLSDSGLAPNSPFPSSSAAVTTSSNGRKDRSLLINSSGNKSGLLIDLTDEVQVPASQGIMTLAEIDDTFGIFNKAPPSHPRVKQVVENDEASKLVRSFTSGRKSDGNDNNVADSGVEAEQEKDSEPSEEQTSVDENDSGGSGSIDEPEQPTIIEYTHQQYENPKTPREEEGITEHNKIHALSCNSGGSDSDILDISNLSSFSIPEADFDDDEFLANIKQDAAGSSAMLDEIRFQLMQEQNESKGPNLLSNITRPSNVPNAVSRVSTSSNVRYSSPPARVPNSNRLSTASTISSIHGDDDDGAPFARAKCRLSGMLSSPIRASYPASKYYMPTPKAATPNAKGSARDKFSQSFCSPNMTRVVVTGDARRSPSRVPVRKSISAETLHFETSPARNRNTTLTILKFSTPSAPSRSRQSLGFQTTFTNEQEMNAEERNNILNTFSKGDRDNYALESDVFRVPRYARLSSASRASSASTNSINTLSPTGSTASTSSYSKKDISDVVRQMKQKRMNDIYSSTNSMINRTTAFSSTATVQPMRATAVIPPSNVSINETMEPSTVAKSNYGSTAVSSTGQRKFIPPVAQSSPKPAASPARPISQTTPSRTRYNSNVKSSGYGMGAQNLNTTFGSKPPLQSPNPKIPASVTAIKPPAVPKSLGTRLQFAAKAEVPRLGSKTIKTAMPPPKMPTTATTGLRRPASGISTVNKENNTRTVGLKTGLSRPRQ